MRSPAELTKLVDETIDTARELVRVNERLTALKGKLIEEATDKERKKEFTDTEGGGKSWAANGTDGSLARVTFPADALKDKFDPATKEGKKIIARFGKLWKKFFRRAIVFVPHEDFRTRVEMEYPPSRAKELIEACEKDSKTSVSFEAKGLGKKK